MSTPIVIVEPPPVIVTVVQAPPPPPIVFVAPPGPPGPSGAEPLAFPLVAAGSVNAAHGLGFYPDVWFARADGEAVLYGIEYPDLSHVSVSFPTPFTGTMYLR